MRDYKGYLIDLDGTIYKGKIKIPAAKRFVEQLQTRKKDFLFVTNNSTKSPEEVATNLATNFDIHVSPENIYTTALATADYVADLDEKKRTVYPIGELGLKQALLDKGFRFEEYQPDYVIVGLDYDVTYHKFELATLAIKRGLSLLGLTQTLTYQMNGAWFQVLGQLLLWLNVRPNKRQLTLVNLNQLLWKRPLERLGCPKMK